MIQFIAFYAGYAEKLEVKTAELSNFLDMMRSASADENGGSSTSGTDWKVGYLVLVALSLVVAMLCFGYNFFSFDS